MAGPLGDIDPVAEMCRVGGAELHPTAALLGGMVSQELIKVCPHAVQQSPALHFSLCNYQVLTAQFVPIDGGFVVNLMDNTTSKLPFA